ncbi:hypothetical protein H8K33_15255 [Undibacterium amnicola]|uniref:Uncharacterized protein n=1 Tax=Undibacterium amnicola TaxID=1834038 RepID=A0ABR6XTU5_9BURK|nr:hypothetical protein [Undibacterium amnicola]MBC3832866.1 hypothetical protein [Undibacterium amnicola]
MAMTAAERQKKRRAKLRQESMTPLLVRGESGEFDERIRIALAVQSLAKGGELSAEIIEKIASRSELVFSDNDLATRKYIRKIVSEFLT